MREINKQRGIFSDKIDVKKEKDYVDYVVNELTEEIKERNNFGMCAPQLGYFARIICLNIEGRVKEFINPVLRRVDKIGFVIEKSLSLEDENKEYLVPRHQEIDIYYQDKKGRMSGCTLKDIAASTFMQLYDILMGTFIDDLYEEKPSNFNDMSEDEQRAYLEEYAQRLKSNVEEMDKEIQDDPTLNDIKERLEEYKVLSLEELKERNKSLGNLNRQKRRTLQKVLDRKIKGSKQKAK